MIKKSDLSNYFAALGRKGAKARRVKLSDAERKAIATKASKAAAKLRSAKAKKKGSVNAESNK